MGRLHKAPDNFECPYKKACPELCNRPALEVRHALEECDRLERRYGMLVYESNLEIANLSAKVESQQKKIDELQAQFTARHRRQFKPTKQRETTIEGPQCSITKRPKKGAPVGHPPWNRTTPDHIDKTVEVPPPEVCPHCRTSGLTPSDELQRQIQEDIVIQPKTVVTEYVHGTSFCPKCRRNVFQTGAGELRNCEIGPVTKASAAFLRHEGKLSYRDVRKIFDVFFGISFVPASAMAFDRTITDKGISLYEDLRAKIQASNIVYGDETHWRIDGKHANTWYAGNEDIAFYHIDRSRASEVAVSIFGDDFAGALGADAYAGYNAINADKRQSCLAHLTRKAKDITEEIELLPAKRQDAKTIVFLESIQTMITHACKVGASRNNGKITQKQALGYIPRFKSLLKTICMHPLKYEKAEKFRQRLIDPKREWRRMFIFLEVPNMHPTNNHAEQALRLPVIFRKICFGNRSLEGAKSMGVLLSLITTAKRQQRNPLKFLQMLITDGAEVAEPLLYRAQPDLDNSS